MSPQAPLLAAVLVRPADGRSAMRAEQYLYDPEGDSSDEELHEVHDQVDDLEAMKERHEKRRRWMEDAYHRMPLLQELVDWLQANQRILGSDGMAESDALEDIVVRDENGFFSLNQRVDQVERRAGRCIEASWVHLRGAGNDRRRRAK